MGITNAQDEGGNEPSTEEISTACAYLAVWKEMFSCIADKQGSYGSARYKELVGECNQVVASKVPSTPTQEIPILDNAIIGIFFCPNDVGDCEGLKKQGFTEFVCGEWRDQHLSCQLGVIESEHSKLCK